MCFFKKEKNPRRLFLFRFSECSHNRNLYQTKNCLFSDWTKINFKIVGKIIMLAC